MSAPPQLAGSLSRRGERAPQRGPGRALRRAIATPPLVAIAAPVWLLGGLLCVGLVGLSGCIPTLSAPRGEAHQQALEVASRHYHHGRMEEAAEAFGEAARRAQRRVDRDEAEYRQARSLRRAGQLPEARALLLRIASRRPIARRTVRAAFDAALIELEIGDEERALTELEAVFLEHPEDGPASRALRLVFLRRRAQLSTEEAFAYLERAYARAGSGDLGDDLLFFEAELALEEGDRPRAQRAFERVIEEHPYPHGQRWDDAHHRLADLALEEDRPREAIALLERMLSVYEHTISPGSHTLPRFPEGRLRIARIYRDRLHEPEAAERAFRATYEDFQYSRLRDDALFELGQMWIELGAEERGCPVLREVVEEFEVGRARRHALALRRERCGVR